jgi:hypothetical protein
MSSYILRPETAESLYYLHELVGGEEYRDQSWAIFEAIDEKCKAGVAYAALEDVRQENPKHQDSVRGTCGRMTDSDVLSI